MIDTIISGVLALLGLILTGVIIPWIKAKTTVHQRETILALVYDGVRAAEQLYGAGKGAEKKKYVTDWLSERGVDTEEIETLIEAAVYELKKE
jgi:hypothetical protein